MIIPLLINTPEIAVAEATYKLPPIPTPPVTINAPVPEDVEAVIEVTAKPETFKISDDGLKVIVESLETAEPEEACKGVNNTG